MEGHMKLREQFLYCSFFLTSTTKIFGILDSSNYKKNLIRCVFLTKYWLIHIENKKGKI